MVNLEYFFWIFWGVPSLKLTWNLKMMVSKRNLLFQGFIFRFHVSFPGCKFWDEYTFWKRGGFAHVFRGGPLGATWVVKFLKKNAFSLIIPYHPGIFANCQVIFYGRLRFARCGHSLPSGVADSTARSTWTNIESLTHPTVDGRHPKQPTWDVKNSVAQDFFHQQ